MHLAISGTKVGDDGEPVDHENIAFQNCQDCEPKNPDWDSETHSLGETF